MTHSTLKAEILAAFHEKYAVMLERYTAPYDAKETDRLLENVDSFLSAAIDKATKAAFTKAIELSNEIEPSNTSMDEWRGFKQFRNTLRDKYLSK